MEEQKSLFHSIEEEFIYFNYFFIKNFNNEEDEIKVCYYLEKIILKNFLKNKNKFVKKERIYFNNLKKF